MALAPGTRLGPYEIPPRSALVAWARALAADADFQQRLQREARTISALDHPHICALFDVCDEAGTGYLVMQYLEGETLAERLTRGQLSVNEAIAITCQVADALDKAQRQGIVHRDLKPANIMLVEPKRSRKARARRTSPGRLARYTNRSITFARRWMMRPPFDARPNAG